MNKIIYFLLLFSAFSYSQSLLDALRYAPVSNDGTARYSATSGVMSTLGGDMSAVSDNPAGSAVFHNNEMSFSVRGFIRNNDANFLDQSQNKSYNTLDFNQGGSVISLNNFDNKALVQRISFGLVVQTEKNLDNNYSFGAKNKSIDQFFLNDANQVKLDDIKLRSTESVSSLYQFLGTDRNTAHQQAFLAYNTYLIDPVSNTADNKAYNSNAKYSSGKVNQNYDVSTKGYVLKTSVNMGVRLRKNIYIGANLNFHKISYTETKSHIETGFDQGSTIKEIFFRNRLIANGNGLSFQLGSIIKFNEQWKVSLSAQTPTTYIMKERTAQHLSTLRDNAGVDTREIIDPQYYNTYRPYSYTTPAKVQIGATRTFGEKGFLAINYHYTDYGSYSFGPSKEDFFNTQNQIIKNAFQGVSAIAVGGEYNIKKMSFRAGGYYQNSPYIATDNNTYTSLSAGLGYHFSHSALDLSYKYVSQSIQYQTYNKVLDDIANIQQQDNIVNVTYRFNF